MSYWDGDRTHPELKDSCKDLKTNPCPPGSQSGDMLFQASLLAMLDIPPNWALFLQAGPKGLLRLHLDEPRPFLRQMTQTETARQEWAMSG